MGEKKGSIFNIIVVVVITGLIVKFMKDLVPQLLGSIGDGANKLVTSGFQEGGITVGG